MRRGDLHRSIFIVHIPPERLRGPHKVPAFGLDRVPEDAKQPAYSVGPIKYPSSPGEVTPTEL